MPAAEEVEGQSQQAAADVVHWGQQVLDAVKRDPKLVDALRPAYIDYLQNHPDA
jgi:DNA-binding protein YbaB